VAAISARSSSEKSGQHAAKPQAEDLYGVRVLLAHDADGGGEIHRADGFGQRISGFDEVFVPHGGSFVWKSLAQAEKAALGCAGSLIAQFPIANPSEVHALRELASDAINVELLKSK
jgi:hypothetical protein